MPKPSRTAQLALEVLEDAIERTAHAPLSPPEHGVRLALAFLFSITLRKNRDPVDALWRGLMGKSLEQGTSRANWCRAQLASIRIDAGFEDQLDSPSTPG